MTRFVESCIRSEADAPAPLTLEVGCIVRTATCRREPGEVSWIEPEGDAAEILLMLRIGRRGRFRRHGQYCTDKYCPAVGVHSAGGGR
jgi:hypothetical protein